MRSILLVGIPVLLAGCPIGRLPPNYFPHGVCRGGSVEVGEVSLERSSCMIYESDRGVFGVLRPGASGELTYDCGGDYAQIELHGPGALGEDASWILQGRVASGELELSSGSGYEGTRECSWYYTYQVTGSPESGALTYRYEEHLNESSSRECAEGCIATATLRVH